ncbi:Dabb family protein [Sinomicrobium soli]|uniref:Dabb family protein n=1 Tax=Sinomicrobium sp. N-1-3-6 TaxID=2219864 RepID=UPI000DCF4899|nr:Dabb family protein [Sinomicrobium sp. N-1-3-6]RAV30174.1 Dabb family protein [Sinomicrobium sp. N-1-3-6]
MKRRNFVRATTAAVTTGVILPVTAIGRSGDREQDTQDRMINHYVLFWLKKTLNRDEKEAFTGFFDLLRKVPGIRSFYYGGPADSKDREVVDNSFDYNLMIQFDSLEALEVYGVHPLHMEAIEQYGHYWEKVTVHDSVLEAVK